MQMLNCSGFPFITVYTTHDSGTNAGSWYKSKLTFDSTNMGVVPVANGLYFGNACFKPSNAVIDSDVHIVCPLHKSDVTSSSTGLFGDDEQVFLISFQTNSGDHQVELILESFGYITADKRTVFMLDNAFASEQKLESEIQVNNSAIASLISSNASEVTRAEASELVLTNNVASNLASINANYSELQTTEVQLNRLFQYFFKQDRTFVPYTN